MESIRALTLQPGFIVLCSEKSRPALQSSQHTGLISCTQCHEHNQHSNQISFLLPASQVKLHFLLKERSCFVT